VEAALKSNNGIELAALRAAAHPER
jgi:hypothetical protein